METGTTSLSILVALFHRLGGAHQAVARHDDAVVGGDEVLLGAVLDRPHALLQRGVLHGDALDAAEGELRLLRGAIDQRVAILDDLATMASEEFSEASEAKRPNVQVGDPFMEKLLLEACLEVMKS